LKKEQEAAANKEKAEDEEKQAAIEEAKADKERLQAEYDTIKEDIEYYEFLAPTLPAGSKDFADNEASLANK